MKHFAVIVAGGSGSRMGGDIAKQFLNLGDKPVLVHTIEKFLSLSFPVEIILVLPAAYKEYWKEYCFKNRLTFRHTLVSGGITRFHSVKNALKHVPEGALVAIHDGVRPFVTREFIEQLYELASESGAVIPVLEPTDSMRIMKEDSSVIVKREEYRMVQTPQVFQSDLLLRAYEQAYSPVFTDDASVVEGMGVKIHLTQGKVLNIKITKPEDLLLAGAILSVS